MSQSTHVNQSLLYQSNSSKQLSKHIFSTKIRGLYYIRYKKNTDQRGFFSELFLIPELNRVLEKEKKSKQNIYQCPKFQVKQVNLAHSKTNVVRGMHAEGWNKLITIINGIGYSCLTDVRPNSPTFQQSEYFLFDPNKDAKYGSALFITKGIANSIAVLKGNLNYLYLVDRLYKNREKSDNLAISIFDPQLNLKWPIAKKNIILSDRDEQAVNLVEALKKIKK